MLCIPISEIKMDGETENKTIAIIDKLASI